MVAEHLTREADTDVSPGRQHGGFGSGHAFRFAGHELDPARRASRTTATGMELIGPGVLDEREHESFVIGDRKGADIFYSQNRHCR